MVETILSKVTGQLEKRFVLNALFPTLVFALALALVGAAGRDGVPPAIDKWEGLSAGIQVLLAIGAVGAVFLVANILANGSLTITRIFEGYAFPSCLFAKPARNWQHARAGRKLKKAKSSYLAADHFETTFPVYPREFTPEKMAPTRLGNVLRSAESYPQDRYGVDGVRVWSRLYPLIEESIATTMVSARTAMEFLLGVSFLAALFTPIATIYLIAMGASDWWVLGSLLVGAVVSVSCYLTALGPAAAYGDQVRAAFDLHRLELIAKLGFPLPATPDEEVRVWEEIVWFLARGDAQDERRYVLPAK